VSGTRPATPEYREGFDRVFGARKDGWRLCPACNREKPGWPDDWRNDAGKGLRYVCAACAEVKP
jgi:hypothetical protein